MIMTRTKSSLSTKNQDKFQSVALDSESVDDEQSINRKGITQITKLQVKKFRVFSGQALPVGRLITVIAGTNCTGKSNILGMLGNSCGFKLNKKDKDSVWLDRKFETEFSEIFKGSLKHEARNSDCFQVFLS